MTCTNPFRMKKPEGGVIELPCGHCIACKIAKSREWASRIIHEMVYYEKAVFLTCTYATDMLPANKSIDVRTLQLFIKKLRKAYPEKRLRYFACGEYGDGKGEREINPHYHLIVFGLGRSERERKTIENAWKCSKTGKNLGYVYFGTVTFQSARYVARYIEKNIMAKKKKKNILLKALKRLFVLCLKVLGETLLLIIKNILRKT